MADARKYAQAQKFTLAVGISTTDTSITLQSFNFPDGTAIASGDLGAINYGTLEPGTSREESISFTGITSNSDGTVTLTGVTRGLGFGAVDTYSEQSDLKSQHGTGAIFILSNTAAFYNDFVNKYNDEEMSGMLTVQTPTASGHAATKQYVDDTVNGGAVSNDRIVQAGTAGESVAEGDLVYFDDTDNEWKKCDATNASTVNNVLIGIAQGSGSNGGAINGGVLTYGLDSTQTGLTPGVKLYASDTAGAIAESAGTVERVIGWSKSATEIYFDANVDTLPTANEKDAMAGSSGTPSSSNRFLTENDASNTTTGNTVFRFSNGHGVSKMLQTSTATAEIANNTAVETDIVSYTVPANLLSTDNAIRVKIYVSNYSSGTITATWRLKYGSTTLATLTTSGSAATDHKGHLEAVLISGGASSQLGTLCADLEVDENDASASTVNRIRLLSSGTATEDSTGALDLKVTIQWGSANATNDFVPAGIIVELIS